ncbi:hypothetical protein [Streptomyces monomycini]|uniref:hypothetical protein n=1 Tax=Streptomyces monomycini TaxID=371720 RepID=UPI0004AAF5BC|nr:hypothetical protein [Streptomyces monomycini]
MSASWPRHPSTPAASYVPAVPDTALRKAGATNPFVYLSWPLCGLSLLFWFIVLTWLLAPVVAAASVVTAVVGFREARRTGVGRTAAWWGLGAAFVAVGTGAAGVYGLCTL